MMRVPVAEDLGDRLDLGDKHVRYEYIRSLIGKLFGGESYFLRDNIDSKFYDAALRQRRIGEYENGDGLWFCRPAKKYGTQISLETFLGDEGFKDHPEYKVEAILKVLEPGLRADENHGTFPDSPHKNYLFSALEQCSPESIQSGLQYIFDEFFVEFYISMIKEELQKEREEGGNESAQEISNMFKQFNLWHSRFLDLLADHIAYPIIREKIDRNRQVLQLKLGEISEDYSVVDSKAEENSDVQFSADSELTIEDLIPHILPGGSIDGFFELDNSNLVLIPGDKFSSDPSSWTLGKFLYDPILRDDPERQVEAIFRLVRPRLANKVLERLPLISQERHLCDRLLAISCSVETIKKVLINQLRAWQESLSNSESGFDREQFCNACDAWLSRFEHLLRCNISQSNLIEAWRTHIVSDLRAGVLLQAEDESPEMPLCADPLPDNRAVQEVPQLSAVEIPESKVFAQNPSMTLFGGSQQQEVNVPHAVLVEERAYNESVPEAKVVMPPYVGPGLFNGPPVEAAPVPEVGSPVLIILRQSEDTQNQDLGPTILGPD